MADETRFAADYLRYQYSDPEKLRIRLQTHEEYSVGTETYAEDVIRALDLAPEATLLDVGCGSGEWWPRLPQLDRLVGADLMPGMLREARGRGGVVVQADARRLPFADGSIDRVLCSGVLYHLRDARPALAAMRRVLKPGGRAVITTNGADTMRRLSDLHAEAGEEIGFRASFAAPAFSMDDTSLLEEIFPSVERHVLEGALLFPTAEPALAFYATGRVDFINPRPDDGSHREPLLRAMTEKIEAIIRNDGVFRVPKSVGWFVATA